MDGNTAEESYAIWVGNKPPEISVISDFFLGSFNAGSNITLTTTATDSDGNITMVEFLVNGEVLGTANQSNGDQYSLNWTPTQTGAFSIQTRATDNQGAQTFSDSKAAFVGINIDSSTLTAIQDVTITENSSSTGNWSTTEIYGSTSAPKIALVEFDLSNISSAQYVESAEFKPYVTKLGTHRDISIAAGTENWSQTSTNWFNAPSKACCWTLSQLAL